MDACRPNAPKAAGLYGVPTEGPTAADHLNVFGAAATTPPTAASSEHTKIPKDLLRVQFIT